MEIKARKLVRYGSLSNHVSSRLLSIRQSINSMNDNINHFTAEEKWQCIMSVEGTTI